MLRIQSDPGQPSQPLPGSAELLMEGRQLLCEPSQLLAPPLLCVSCSCLPRALSHSLPLKQVVVPMLGAHAC